MAPITACARRPRILLVEDSDLDAKLAERAFDRAGLPVDLKRVTNGRECLDFLRREQAFCNAERPDVVLLDLNMPLMSGYEVLEAIAADESLCDTPVVVLSTSTDERDIRRSYRLRCSSYVAKPTDFKEFQSLLETMCKYWFTAVTLPTEN